MFGRAKEKQASPVPGEVAQTAPAGSHPVKPTGKGRPTPSRAEAQAARRRPLVPADRKAARTAARAAVREERARMHHALLTGDEKHLPARDKGPQKRLARDIVDSRRNVGEYFLMIALVALVLSFIAPTLGSPEVLFASTVLIYSTLVVVVVDSIVVSRRVKREAAERFGTVERGLGGYAVSRALQVRRLRRPVVMVRRGAPPR
ncbi:Protein of unknown function (DUF3043) [Kineococcus xinjiangensis]|uniref:DUF3043 family protein n=1 Tax=Kineococcus xinjiangensis TaxID=512762 RepID=A0A2S6IM62_9ACTN|nr:DUF3043 domain-containing protein [Kineococcus xinjiangensis]PPK95309.1 Protein of unknown function (DUF3043) [Kineococcus xinjiangensis]